MVYPYNYDWLCHLVPFSLSLLSTKGRVITSVYVNLKLTYIHNRECKTKSILMVSFKTQIGSAIILVSDHKIK